MSIDLLERGARALGPLIDQVAFVGGATITLWITDPAAPPPRPTKDVDVVIEVTFIAEQMTALIAQPRFVDAVYGFLPGDDSSQARAEAVVLPRLHALAES